jgi:hypothetical protein
LERVSPSLQAMSTLVEDALQGMSAVRRAPAEAVHQEVPVRAPRTRTLVRTLLQGDALKADVKQFFRKRQASLPAQWDMDVVIQVERSLAREPGYREGGFLGLLRFACDLADASRTETTWTETRLWFLLRKRLSSSSGLMLLRSVANSHEVVQSLLDDPDGARRRGFCDLLRVLGARTGQILLEHPRLIDRPIWEFTLLLTIRADRYNRNRNSKRIVQPLDVFCGAIFVYLRERGLEPGLAELRSSALQAGAPLSGALDVWVEALQAGAGSSLIQGTRLSDDPRQWIWLTGLSVLEQSGLTDRIGRIASGERALLERARALETWKDDLAIAIEALLRREIDRALPESRRLPFSFVQAENAPAPGADPIPPIGNGGTAAGSGRIPSSDGPSPRPDSAVDSEDARDVALAAEQQLRLAMVEFGGRGWSPSTETSEGIPTIGFGLSDLERQARWVGDGWKSGWTPTGHVWADKFRTLLGDPRVREFLRLGPSWVAGLREILTESEPWTMAGWEDLVRWIYPAKFRPIELEFRQNQRPYSPGNRTGYDWTVLRLMSLTLAEVAGAAREPGLAPSCLVVLRNWQRMSPYRELVPHSQDWWAWLAEEVDQRTEAEANRSFPTPLPLDDEWRVRYMAPWIAFPSPASASVLGEWVRDPLAALHADSHLVHERWASRLSMLTQLQDEAKEEAMSELSRRLA